MAKPGDALENVIIKRMPSSVAEDLTKAKLRATLETFGSQCLLILDGYDEHDGFNDHVRQIVENKSLGKCHIILSSRPHSVIDIERYFTTVVSVKGFSRKMADKFASKILRKDKYVGSKVSAILSFDPIGIGKNMPLYSCPILLSFLCLLVREQKIDFRNQDSITFGQIYTKMAHCLFTKYTKGKGINDCQNEYFAKVLFDIGQMALGTLTGNPILKRSEITDTIGPFQFDYGLLFGQEDCNQSIATTEGLLITFSHRSLQEFLGSFNFTKSLTLGESITNMVALDDESPVFMVNPLFLHFCLWFLLSNLKDFYLEGKDDVCEKLKKYITRRLGRAQVDFVSMGELFLALDMKHTKDKLSVQFYQSIIAALDTPKHLLINTANDIHSILSAMGASLRTVKSIVLRHKDDTNGALGCSKLVPWQNSSEMNVIVEGGVLQEVLHKVLWHCCKLDIHPVVFIFPESHSCKKLDISTVLREDISKLYLMSEQGSLLLVSQNSDDLFCPYLTDVRLVNTEVHESILSSLNEVVDKGFMETLTHMSFISCKGLMGKLHFSSIPPNFHLHTWIFVTLN